MTQTHYDDNLINTSTKSNLVDQPTAASMPPEKTETFFGANAIGQISVGILRANTIISGIILSANGKTAFDLDNNQIYLSDGTFKRVLLDGTTPKFVISKPGVDASTATAAQSLAYIDNTGTFQRLQSTFSTGPVQRVNNFNLGGGFVARDLGQPVNYYSSLLFYIPSSWTILSAQAQFISKDAGFDNGGTFQLTRPKNMSFRVNPTETRNGGGASAYYWTFSGGQALATGVNPAADNDTFSYTLSAPQLAALTSGWNQIVAQQDTDDFNFFGNVGISITIEYMAQIT